MDHRPTPPPSVLHVTGGLSGQVPVLMAAAMRELARAGVQQTLLHGSGSEPLPDILARLEPRIRQVALPAQPANAGPWAYVRTLRAALRNEFKIHRHDAVHLHAAAAGPAGRLALRSLVSHPPAFYSPQGDLASERGSSFAAALAALFERTPVFSGCQPVACCATEARRLERHSGRPPLMLPPPVDAGLFELQRGATPPQRVICVGAASASQAPELFAELAARFHFAGEPARFVWVGGGEARFEQLLRAAGVEVTGNAEPEAVQAELGRADVVVQTARRDATTLVVAQAMAAGLPCVAADVPGHRDVIRHPVTGLLVGADVSGLAVMVKALLDDPERAGRLGEAARREARQRFHPDQFRQALLTLYQLHGRAASAERALVRRRQHDSVAT